MFEPIGPSTREHGPFRMPGGRRARREDHPITAHQERQTVAAQGPLMRLLRPGNAGPDPRARAGRLGYMPGIDGLRAIAVGSVLIYHLGAAWLPGGYLGVDVFFVISGFLITSLLVSEHRATGRIALRRFWLRRAWRLLPAVLLMMLLTLTAMLILHPEEVGRLRGQVVAALAYVINWHFVFADVPYFEQFGRPSVLLHLWSLSIEEQFYLVWPPLLALALPRVRRMGLLAAVTLAAGGSAALAWVLWEPFQDPSRIYYGTDTRAVALLCGVALALLAAGVAGGEAVTRWRPAKELVGIAGMGAVVVAMLTLGDLEERLYRGGFLLVALATAGAIWAAADSGSILSRVLGVRPMVWIGLRSYGIYLWHWPVIMLTRPDVDVPFDGPTLVALRVGLTLGIAALSYRFVETPLRRHGMAGVRAGYAWIQARWGRAGGVATASSAAFGIAAVAVLVALSPVRTPAVPGLDAASAQTRTAPAAAPDPAAGTRAVLFVGDSVMLGASPALRTAFGDRAVVDAAVGRRFPEGSEIVLAYLKTLPADADVVIHLGNNYFVRPDDLDGLMRRLPAGHRVFLVTVRVPLDWQDSVNEILRGAPARYDNITLIDWHAASGGPGLLVDGAHMNERGMAIYTDLITAALRDDAGPADGQ